MRFVRGVAFASGWILVGGACALPSMEEYASGGGNADTARDGAPPEGPGGSAATDGGAPDDTTTPSADADTGADTPVVNLMPPAASYFEDRENVDCEPAGGYRSIRSSDPTARTGGGSCRICRSSSNGLFSIDTQVMLDPPLGTYRARAWVRVPDGMTPFEVVLVLRSQRDDYSQIEIKDGAPRMLSTEWQMIEADFELTRPVKRMNTYLYGEPRSSVSPACFLVDDYEVWHTP
ncbi:MAG: hypothetical protein KIT84_08775 [Labilithrix sp.]|nr:hypothetical protein [Labilithrix sp.]MCW5811092.1 hypothetical protein [Labilithrix sp.]